MEKPLDVHMLNRINRGASKAKMLEATSNIYAYKEPILELMEEKDYPTVIEKLITRVSELEETIADLTNLMFGEDPE
jgi:hypothetical protein